MTGDKPATHAGREEGQVSRGDRRSSPWLPAGLLQAREEFGGVHTCDDDRPLPPSPGTKLSVIVSDRPCFSFGSFPGARGSLVG